jgi:hypothetical protein
MAKVQTPLWPAIGPAAVLEIEVRKVELQSHSRGEKQR